MKLNYDCVRDVLLAVENAETIDENLSFDCTKLNNFTVPVVPERYFYTQNTGRSEKNENRNPFR